MMLSSVDLPEPEGQQHDELALIERQGDLAKRVHLDLAHPVDFRQTPYVEDNRRDHSWPI